MPAALEGRVVGGRGVAVVETGQTVEEVWRQYKLHGLETLRRLLIIHYMDGHVRRLANRLHSTLPQQVEVDDLVQQGYLGLVEAIERFDIDRQIKFETFSARRITGAMRDWLREIDPMPRLARSRARRMEAITEEHRKSSGLPPTDSELLDGMDIGSDKLQQVLAGARAVRFVRYQSTHPDIDAEDDGDAMAAVPDKNQRSPLTDAVRSDLCRWITRGFCRRDRLIIILYYYEHLTMREVGQALGISESRVSQRLDGIVACLRARMEAAELE